MAYEVAGQVASVTFDDGKANALTVGVLRELDEALDRSEREATALVLGGRPQRFSAGFDLPTMTSGGDPMRELVAAGGRFAARLLTHPMPVVAACTGHALAAGALLLLAADVRIGAAGPWKIGLNEVAIGMPLPTWGVELARYRMPPGAFDRIALGEIGDPEEAVAAGFLDRVVPADELLGAAAATAERLAGLRRGAVAGTKSRMRTEAARRMLEGMDEELASITGPS